MAWTHIGLVGSAQSKAGNQGSLAVSVTTTAAVDAVLILVVAKDNAQTTFADNSEFTSVTDSQSNTWVKAHERTGSGNAKAKSVCGIFRSKLTTELVGSTDTITVNFAASSSNDASAAIVEKFTIGASNVVSDIDLSQADTDTADPASVASGTVASAEHLAIYGMAWERPGSDDFTAGGGGYAEFDTGDIGTTGGGAASNMTAFGQYDIFTGTTITGDPSEAGSETADHVSLQVLFDEGEAPSGRVMSSLVGSGGLVGPGGIAGSGGGLVG